MNNQVNNQGIIGVLQEMEGERLKIKTRSVKIGANETAFVYVLESFKIINDEYIQFYDKKNKRVLLKLEDISSISQDTDNRRNR